jgi:hypothetical protein
MIVSDQLKRAKIRSDLRIRTEFENVPLTVVLADMLANLDLDYYVADGTLKITTRTDALRRLVTWTYHVKSFIHDDDAFRALVDEVYRSCHPSLWKDTGGPAALTTDVSKREFTVVHSQSDQDRILRLVMERKQAASEAVEE